MLIVDMENIALAAVYFQIHTYMYVIDNYLYLNATSVNGQ